MGLTPFGGGHSGCRRGRQPVGGGDGRRVDRAGTADVGSLQNVALEEADDPLAIALHPEEALLLAAAEQIVEAREAELPPAEPRADAAGGTFPPTARHRPAAPGRARDGTRGH